VATVSALVGAEKDGTDGMIPASQFSTDTPVASLASSDRVTARLQKYGRSAGLHNTGGSHTHTHTHTHTHSQQQRQRNARVAYDHSITVALVTR